MTKNRYLPFLSALTLLTSLLSAVTYGEEAKKSLTYQKYPSSFTTKNPLTPNSFLLLKFSEPVSTRAVQNFFRFFEKDGKTYQDLEAVRPTEDEIFDRIPHLEAIEDLETFVLVSPKRSLALNKTWYLYGRSGLTSTDKSHRIVEGKLNYVGAIRSFEIYNVNTANPYNEKRKLVIEHNKPALGRTVTPESLAGYIQISPTVENLEFNIGYKRIEILGDLKFGVNYEVTIREGITARDGTRSEQFVEKEATILPNPGFISYPAFSTTQNAAGHRKFEIKTGNLTGLRTRVKHLEGDELVLGLHEYDAKYEGWGGPEDTPYAMAPGKTIYDEYSKPTAGIDQSENLVLRWDELTNKEPFGAYLLCSEGRSATRDKLSVGAQALIQLTDIGLAWKQSAKNHTTLYAFSLRSGRPLNTVAVRIVDETAKVHFEGATDESGFLQIPPIPGVSDEDSLYLDAQLAKDRHLIHFHNSLNRMGLWSFAIPQRYSDPLEGERRTLLFTDRNVYRPGDEVKLKAISRFVDVDKLLGAAPGEGTLRIFNARHRKIFEEDVTLSANGSYDHSFQLPQAGMGWHTIELDFNPEEGGERNDDWRLITSHSFQVEDYKVNTFEISLATEPSYKADEIISVPLSARYYMGKPLTKASFNWNVYSYTNFPRPRGFDEFRFGDVTQDFESFNTSGEGKLNPDGESLIEFALPDQGTSPSPRNVSISTQITDANQQTISNGKSITVHSSDFYLGLRNPESVHRAGDQALFSVVALDTKGKTHFDEVHAMLTIERERWSTVKVIGANGRPTFRNERRLETVSEKALRISTTEEEETGLTQAHPFRETFSEAGDYLVTLAASDSQGRPVLTRSRFTVIGADEPAWSWHDVVRIDLTPDKETYRAGETAKLLARSPVFGHAILTTERGGVRTTESIEISDYETILEIPVDADAAPNIFASLLIIRGSDESTHINKAADYRLGYCQLNVEDPDATLLTAIDIGEKESRQPGEEIVISATVTSHDGAAVPNAEVTLFAVDEGVLSLTGHKTPDPAEVFFKEFSLAVSTGQSLGDLLPENVKEQYFDNKGYVIGGGGANKGLRPDKVRKDFKALAFWEPSLKTDENGLVSATFTVPDNLTTFRVMAVVAEGNRFSKAETPLVVNKPLIIEPALPRFTNVTDQIDVAAIIHNNTKVPQEISLKVQLDDKAQFLNQLGDKVTTSLTSPDEARTRITKAIIAPGKTESFAFPIALTETGEAKWQWSVANGDQSLRDATESTMTIGYPLPLLRESRQLSLLDNADTNNALQDFSPRLLTGNGEIQINLSNSRLVEAGDALQYLLRYPYGCVEQTTSSIIPWLSTTQLRHVLPEMEKDEEEVATIIEKGISRLFSMQTGDGGLGYWPGANQSELWGSAYAAVAISLASRQEIPVPEEQVKALQKYLSTSLRKSGDLKEAYQLSQRCLACYALALFGKPEEAYHEVLFERRSLLSAEARALLALAMTESNAPAQDRIAMLLAHDPEVPVAEISWYKQPYILATKLLAQLKHDPESGQVDELVTRLFSIKGPQHGWGSTYSNAWPLIALAEYGKREKTLLGENTVELVMGGEKRSITLGEDAVGHQITLPLPSDNSTPSLQVTTSESSPVFANLIVASRPEIMPIEPENNGFSIERTYQEVRSDGTIEPATDLEVGDLVLVTLDLNIPNEKEAYLAIDDPLPAVFEAINPNFKSQATKNANTRSGKRTLYANHREIRRDRVLFFADSIFRSGDYTLQYLARVNAPGEVTAPPAKLEAMYEPHRFGLSGTGTISACAADQGKTKIATR